MKDVLLISDKLEHYRIPLFDLLCDSINLTVACSNDNYSEITKFSQSIITVENRGPFILYGNLPNFDNFDVVIFSFNIRCLELWKQIFKKRKYKLFVFGIGVSASYGKFYDQSSRLDIFRKFILSKSDSAIFYEQYPYIKYTSCGISPNKMSVAYNTVYPNPDFDFDNKEYKSFIFIGSLYRQKKIFDLLEAYFIAYTKSHGQIQSLEIIGDGDEYENIEKWIEAKGLKDKIVLHGFINDDQLLLPIFNRAIACISPGQAGLSVQKCFSYGVPFITSENPITGGELFSIIDGVNGYIYDSSINHLSSILLSFNEHQKTLNLSRNAFNYYTNFRNVSIWKRGFLKNII